MSWLRSILAGDEELGKKDDDHRPVNGIGGSAPWSARKQAPISRRRRIAYVICGLLLTYVFIKNIPTDLGPTRRYAPAVPGAGDAKLAPDAQNPSTRKPKHPSNPTEAEEHYHDGPIKFYMLAASLHGAARLDGQHELNKNVLFAASSLKSVSEILPLACEMARWERNNVHFVLMGRDDRELVEIKKLNGAEEDCDVHWHDARPDFSRWSSDFRMEVSVTASMKHINTFIHPQIIIIDDPDREDDFFINAIRSKSMEIGKGIIELPPDAMETMMWLTRLDSGSLAAWTATYVDIVIQAPPDSSGSLVRLLKSIESADYFGIRRPHLTIELPAEVDPPTWRYLQNLVWPPLDWSGAPHASQVSLRHRIPRRTSTEYESSARLVESFYPVREANSHVLLLSSQTELSPLYYHFVIYNLLEYKYSAYGAATTDFPNLMGFSLELPAYHLNDTKPFEPPLLEKPSVKGRAKPPEAERTPFLWQAPNANAALYFGDKWMEFHSFLSARLSKPPSQRVKVFSKKHPAWLEFLLELMRARGYSMLYPNFPSDGDVIATVHNDLYQVPEEYLKEKTQPRSTASDLDPDKPLEADTDEKPSSHPSNIEHNLSGSNLISLLPNSGDLPEISRLPLISYNGINMSAKLSHEAATSFAELYRREIGTCRNIDETTPRAVHSALDLFCHLDDVYDPLIPWREQMHSYDIAQRAAQMPYVPPLAEPRDEDRISAEHHEQAKQEATAHQARQQGLVAPVPVIPVEPLQNDIQPDAEAGAQDEFKLQMERQAQLVGNGASATAATKVSVEHSKTSVKDEAMKTSSSPPPISTPQQSAAAVQTHDSFTMQVPPKAVEDSSAGRAQEKGSGW